MLYRQFRLLFALFLLIGTFACEPPPPTPTATAIIAPPTSALPVAPFVLIDSRLPDSPDLKPVVIEFLIDRSGSVTECGPGFKTMRDNYIRYVMETIGSIYKNSTAGKNEKVNIGIGQFRGGYETVMLPTTDFDIPHLPEMASIDETSYSVGIKGAIKDINAAELMDAKKVIVLITDGFEAGENLDSVFSTIRDSLIADVNLSIYVNLLCSDKLMGDQLLQWQENIDAERAIVYTTSETGKWVSSIFNEIQEYLPTEVSYFELTETSPVFKFKTNGYSNRYTVMPVFLPGEGYSISVQDSSVGSSNLITGQTSDELNFLRGCKSHEISFELNAPIESIETEFAFILIQEGTFPNLSLSYSLSPAEWIINDDESTLILQVSDPLVVGKLGEWAECFRIDLEDTSNNTTITPYNPVIYSDDSNDSLFSSFGINVISAPSSPINLPIRVTLRALSSDEHPEAELRIGEFWLYQKFKPEISLISFEASSLSYAGLVYHSSFELSSDSFEKILGDVDSNNELKIKFISSYTHSDPIIVSLRTSRADEEINTCCNRMSPGCLKFNTITRTFSVFLDEFNDEELNKVLVKLSSNTALPGEYLLEAYKYILDRDCCGFDTITFVWEEQDLSLPVTRECDLFTEGECREIP